MHKALSSMTRATESTCLLRMLVQVKPRLVSGWKNHTEVLEMNEGSQPLNEAKEKKSLLFCIVVLRRVWGKNGFRTCDQYKIHIGMFTFNQRTRADVEAWWLNLARGALTQDSRKGNILKYLPCNEEDSRFSPHNLHKKPSMLCGIHL